jgi:outer membrane protein OmpA-like peptidoglycan-associated protein
LAFGFALVLAAHAPAEAARSKKSKSQADIAGPKKGSTKPSTTAKGGDCSALATRIATLLNERVGPFAARLHFNIEKRLLGITAKAAAQAPVLKFSGKATAGSMIIEATLKPAVLKGSIKAGIFGTAEGAISVPANPLSFSVKVPCARDCAGWTHAVVENQGVVNFLVAQINKKILGRLPKRLTIKKLTVNVDWPQVALSAKRGQQFDLRVSSWGVRSASYKELDLPFAEKLRFPTKTYSFACGKSDKPVDPPTPPKPIVDDELTCNARIPYKIHFASNDAKIDPSYKANDTQLNRLAKALRTVPKGCTIKVVGHTDCQGPANYNQQLGQSRAQATVGWMLQQSGLPAHLKTSGRINSESRGFSKPWCTTYKPNPSVAMNQQCSSTDANDECLVANRRVYLVLSSSKKQGK